MKRKQSIKKDLKLCEKIAKIVVLSVLLSSCVNKKTNEVLDLKFPVITHGAIVELLKVCDDKRCPALKNWMYDLLTFQEEFNIMNDE